MVLIFGRGNYWLANRLSSMCINLLVRKIMFMHFVVIKSNILIRYWSDKNYEFLVRTKSMWDPQNVFNHCHSVGSNIEDCCPKDI